jgi:glutathione S-transferase
VWHKRGTDGLAPASYLALHPAATAPVVQDGDRTLCESAAILEYVCHKYAGGRLTVSPDQPNFYDYVYWMHFHNNILGLFFTRLALRGQTEGRIAGFVHRREDGYARMLEQTLAASPFHAGPQLAADVRRPRRPLNCAILCRADQQAARVHQSDADCRTHGRTA